MKNAIFIHCAILERVDERIHQYLTKIVQSELIDHVEYIFISVIGDYDKIPFIKYTNDKIILLKSSPNLTDYELPTLQVLYDFCMNHEDYNVLYLHTKGVGKEINLCIEDQVEYMTYFLIEKWRNAVQLLEQYKTVGVDLRNEPTLHYSGNFWWATSKYISGLPCPREFNSLERYPNPLNSLRHNQEFWICYDKQPNLHSSLYDCGIDVYSRHLVRFEKNKYM